MIAIICNSIIYFVVCFAKQLKLLAWMPWRKLRKFQASGFQPKIQNAISAISADLSHSVQHCGWLWKKLC